MSILIDNHIQKIVSNIQTIRIHRNYSQDYVASKVGMSQNGYSKIETGCSSISLVRLFQIAEALEVEITDLIKLNDITNLQQLYPKKLGIEFLAC